jgi:hypothetical protein
MVGAAAAAIVVSIVLSRPETAEPTRITDDFAIRIGDADRNNTIDIRDALALARKIEGGDVKWTRWEDVNQDKVVDRQDVDAVAMLAVRIEPEAVR